MLSQSGYLLTVYYAIQLGVSSGTTALIDGVQPLVAGALAGPLPPTFGGVGEGHAADPGCADRGR
ncbi:hypothetical protein ACFY1U_22950 [Streptomyces sp. NPDC001351]|uniref:hypothetical protein n=1 Tax=Streptomyces sp. NPDC001351 TaxID=3364564 RepID=UPI0036AE7832